MPAEQKLKARPHISYSTYLCFLLDLVDFLYSKNMLVPGTGWLQLSLILWGIKEAAGAQHSVGILMPWTVNLFGYPGFGPNGSLLYAYSGLGSRAQMAITLGFAAIQEDDSLLQEVRELTWVWHDDGCDDEKSIFATAQLIKEYGVKGIIGPSCETITGTIAKYAFYEDIPVIGYSIPSFTRSTNSDLPNLIRTIAPYTSLGDCVVGMMKAFDWAHLFILYESGDSTGWELLAQKIAETAKGSNVTVESTFFLSAANAGASASAESFSTAVSSIKTLGYRIILIIGGCESGLKLGYYLYQNSMEHGYAIITMTSLTDMDCVATSVPDIHEVFYINNTLHIDFERPEDRTNDFEYNALSAYYSFEQYQTPPNGTAKRTGPNKGGNNPFNLSYEYASEFELNLIRLYGWEDEWGFVSYLYDSILLYARVLNYTLSNGLNSTYKTFMSAVPHVTPFEGAWRSVEFNSIGSTFDRELEGRVYQVVYINKTVGGVSDVSFEWTPIASQNSSGFFMLTAKDSIVWPGPSTEIPKDYVNATVPCTPANVDSHVSHLSASTFTFTVSYTFKEGISCDTQSYDLPSDQTLKVNQFPVASAIGVVVVLCVCLGTIMCASIALFAVYFGRHPLLTNSSLSLTSVWLAFSLLAVCSPLAFLGEPSDATCQLRSFALILPGFMLSAFMVARIHLLASMISSPKKDNEQSHLITSRFFTLYTSPVWLLLIIGAAYEPPTSYSEYVQPSHAPLTVISNFGCNNINESVFTAILLYLAIGVLYGLWMTSRVLGQLILAAAIWKSSKRVWEVRFLTYVTYVALVAQVELLVASFYLTNADLDRFRVISSICASLAASTSLCVIWVPRMALILNENINAPDASSHDPDSCGVNNTGNPMHKDNSVQKQRTQLEEELFQIPARASALNRPDVKKSDKSSNQVLKVSLDKSNELTAPPSPSAVSNRSPV